MASRFAGTRPLGIAAGFTAFVALLLSLSLLATTDPPTLGATTIPIQGDAHSITWVMPGGYAAEAGLRPGDTVRSTPIPSGSPAWGAFQITQGPRAGETVELVRRWPVATDLVLFALALEFLAAALIVFLRASDRPAAHRFTLLAVACAVTIAVLPAMADGQPWALVLEWFGSKIGMAAFALFFLTVPVERWRPLRRLLLWAPAPILAFYCYTMVGHADLYSTVKPLGYAYMSTGIVVGMVAMLWPFFTRVPREQRRLWPVVLCTGLAAAAYLGGYLLPYLLWQRYLLPVEVAIGCLGFIPLGFAWAMLQRPIMGMTLGSWALLKTVLESISDPIFVVRRDGQLVDASRAGLALLGIERANQASERFERLVARVQPSGKGSGALGPSLVRRVLAGEVVQDEEQEFHPPHGEPVCMSVAGTPLFGERGQVDMVVLVCRDITERKRREKARRELERQKDDFIANISHDLKTPLAAIKFAVGVVQTNEPPEFPPPLRRMLANVDASVDKMSSLIEDLLELGRLQAGRAQLRLSRCDLRDLALRCAATIEPLAAERQQQLHLDLPAEAVPALVDGARLERAITNLLSNANRYAHRGGTIRLSLRRNAGEALLAVADDGPGIPQVEQARVFERFYRAEQAAARCVEGSGLGLPIARAMVELHGGRMWVESRPGSGATFWMALPARLPESVAV